MIFFSILCALLIDHFKPLRANNLFFRLIQSVANQIRKWFDAGEIHHGRAGWCVTVVIFVIPVLIIYWFCLFIHPFFGLLWNILILYLCMGFKNYNHYFSSIQMALLNGEEITAKRVLTEWCGCDTSDMNTSDITRTAIEKALIAVQKDVFGIIFWFILPFGPAGAVFYRVSVFLQKYWNEKECDDKDFGKFAKKIFYWIDWMPVRLTAIAFAIVGNFEDAIFAWRNFTNRWKNRNMGILLAAGGGAMGVKLGNPYEKAFQIIPIDMTGYEKDLQPGEEPAIRFFQSTLGLIWRALLLWLLLLFLFTMTFYLA